MNCFINPKLPTYDEHVQEMAVIAAYLLYAKSGHVQQKKIMSIASFDEDFVIRNHIDLLFDCCRTSSNNNISKIINDVLNHFSLRELEQYLLKKKQIPIIRTTLDNKVLLEFKGW